MRLFHFVPKALWPQLAGLRFSPPSLANEGFVHLSAVHQLAGTLQVHFAGVPELLLIELDPERLGANLRMEPSRGGEDFPHLYRAIEQADIRHGWRLAAGPDGLASPDLDQPNARLNVNEFWAS